jgi:hypothetical protein
VRTSDHGKEAAPGLEQAYYDLSVSPRLQSPRQLADDRVLDPEIVEDRALSQMLDLLAGHGRMTWRKRTGWD